MKLIYLVIFNLIIASSLSLRRPPPPKVQRQLHRQRLHNRPLRFRHNRPSRHFKRPRTRPKRHLMANTNQDPTSDDLKYYCTVDNRLLTPNSKQKMGNLFGGAIISDKHFVITTNLACGDNRGQFTNFRNQKVSHVFATWNNLTTGLGLTYPAYRITNYPEYYLCIFMFEIPPKNYILQIKNQTFIPLPAKDFRCWTFGMRGGAEAKIKKIYGITMEVNDCKRFIDDSGLKKSDTLFCVRVSDCSVDLGAPYVCNDQGRQTGYNYFGAAIHTALCSKNGPVIFENVRMSFQHL